MAKEYRIHIIGNNHIEIISVWRNILFRLLIHTSLIGSLHMRKTMNLKKRKKLKTGGKNKKRKRKLSKLNFGNWKFSERLNQCPPNSISEHQSLCYVCSHAAEMAIHFWCASYRMFMSVVILSFFL